MAIVKLKNIACWTSFNGHNVYKELGISDIVLFLAVESNTKYTFLCDGKVHHLSVLEQRANQIFGAI